MKITKSILTKIIKEEILLEMMSNQRMAQMRKIISDDSEEADMTLRNKREFEYVAHHGGLNKFRAEKGIDLSGAYLAGANLEKASLAWANIQGANLEKAYLKEAYLKEADLKRANLTGADLEGARLLGANLKRATYNSETKFNTGFNPEDHGMVLVQEDEEDSE